MSLLPPQTSEVLSKRCRLFGISRGQDIGVLSLLGVWRKGPEQVRDSDVSSTQSPVEPEMLDVLGRMGYHWIDEAADL